MAVVLLYLHSVLMLPSSSFGGAHFALCQQSQGIPLSSRAAAVYAITHSGLHCTYKRAAVS
jgi:hypothetical protein